MKTLSRRDLEDQPADGDSGTEGEWKADWRRDSNCQNVFPASTSARRESTTPAPTRLLLDFGWRFHFGNAYDPAKDFAFGSGRTGNFRRRETSFLPAPLRSMTAIGKLWICPTIGPWNCLSKTTPRLPAKGYRGTELPGHSVGWCHHVFELSAAVADKRITLSSMAPTGRRWWSSTASISAGTAADAIRSVSM